MYIHSTKYYIIHALLVTYIKYKYILLLLLFIIIITIIITLRYCEIFNHQYFVEHCLKYSIE